MKFAPFRRKPPVVTDHGSAHVNEVDTHFARADRLRDMKRWPEASEAYAAGLDEDPEAFAMWVQYGHALKESGRQHDAGQAYLQAERLNDEDCDLKVQLGHLNRLMGNQTAARQYYRKAVKLGSDDLLAIEGIASPISAEARDLACTLQTDKSLHPMIRDTWASSDSFAQMMLAAVGLSTDGNN